MGDGGVLRRGSGWRRGKGLRRGKEGDCLPVGKVPMRRVVWTFVPGCLRREIDLGQEWPLISPKDSETVSICHGPGFLPGAPMTERTESGRLSCTKVY